MTVRNMAEESSRGQNLIEKNPDLGLDENELQQLYDFFMSEVQTKGVYEAVWTAIKNAYYTGVSIGKEN